MHFDRESGQLLLFFYLFILPSFFFLFKAAVVWGNRAGRRLSLYCCYNRKVSVCGREIRRKTEASNSNWRAGSPADVRNTPTNTWNIVWDFWGCYLCVCVFFSRSPSSAQQNGRRWHRWPQREWEREKSWCAGAADAFASPDRLNISKSRQGIHTRRKGNKSEEEVERLWRGTRSRGKKLSAEKVERGEMRRWWRVMFWLQVHVTTLPL